MDKILFTDQSVQFPNRYRFVPVDEQNGIYDIVPAFGELTQEGTPLRALEFNQMQENIEAALTEQDTGWVAIPTSSLENGFRAYSGGSVAARVRKIGNIVYLSGTVSPPLVTNRPSEFNLGTSDTTRLFVLDAQYRPSSTTPIIMCKGSSAQNWCLRVTSAGEALASHYANENGLFNPTADTTWMPFNLVYFV